MSDRGVIGIDVGGKKVYLAIFDRRLRVVDDLKERTEPEKDAESFGRRLAGWVGWLLGAAARRRLRLVGIGVGCAGRIDRAQGVVLESANIPCLEGFPLRRRLEKLAALPALVGNDVELGLQAEHRLGAAVGRRHVLGVFFGTGVGGALIINGKPYLGASGLAGNAGRVLVPAMGGPAGRLDDVSSGNAIAGDLAKLAAKQWAPRLFRLAGADVTRIKNKTMRRAVEEGDERVKKLLMRRARMAGVGLAGLVSFLNPEMLVLGGGLVDTFPTVFLRGVKRGIRQGTDREVWRALKVSVSALRGRAVATGAAQAAWDAFS